MNHYMKEKNDTDDQILAIKKTVTKSIPEIDQQLYDKYGLSDDEIAFIEKNVKEMK